ncbi:receptor activity-modifying protein 1 isoform X1 [Protopterus annectens]|uniref:receptor activity-modifying protein 1 isoform X1 n=1 Tax=Protopterus annectens TaxID=7888 RepID=UPI001CF93CD6|nr:receptor activity-modifying protein 1 isoform X1 [Protopterus annectens]
MLFSFSAHHFILVTTCENALYSQFIQEFCFDSFKFVMDATDEKYWCDWEKTQSSYGDLTNCTILIAEKLKCYWPNQVVDDFFITIHRNYFKNCPLTGRAPRDPPNNVLCAFIMVPMLITLLMTALVVWRSKYNEGIV